MDASASFFLDTFDLSEGALARAFGEALSSQVDYADLYFEHAAFEAVSLEERLVKKATRSLNQGVGVRAIAGDKTGYAHSNEIDVRQIEAAARAARVIALGGSARGPVSLAPAARARDLYPVPEAAIDVPLERKVALLQQADALARSLDPRIVEVQVSFATELKTVAVLSSDGTLTGDRRPLCRFQATCIAVEGNERQVGSSGGGGRVAWDWFLEPHEGAESRAMWHVREAVRQALLLLRARPAPAATLDVVLGPGWPGVLLHEAVGHGLEGDFNRKGTSVFSSLLGKPVASPLCTVVDDGSIAGRRGSLNVDDEGTPTQRTVLIENGVLVGYLQDRLNARLMGMAPTGNGRRESFQHVPMPRMTNTFMLAGDTPPADIIASVKKGIYAVSFGGGQVDITSGKFVFSMSEAYEINDGQLGAPLKGATLIGSGAEVLKRVSAVGNDLALDRGVGMCGKEGQSVPVGVGMPTLRVDGITVGGTAR